MHMPPPLLPDDARAAGVRTLVDVLAYRAARQPNDTVFTFLVGDGITDGTLTYQELDTQAHRVAAHLREHTVPGERVLLLVPPGLEYIVAFFGCLVAGVVAVPAYPPHPRRGDPRLSHLVTDCDARIALVTRALLSRGEGWLSGASALRTLRTLDIHRLITEPAPGPTERAQITGGTLAMLQYTSGSTSEPRGVMLTHDNLLHNSRIIHRVTAHREGDRAVFWLPPFHDMGLIGGIIQPVYAHVPATLMAPATFLQRPARWLEAMSATRATTTSAPNSAYDLCVDRISEAERRSLDLSAWRVGFNGAEFVRAETIERFYQCFAASGLGRDVLFPCYGLAEATLLVAGGVAAHAAATDDAAVSCGTPDPEVAVTIVDPDNGMPLPDGSVGEIWVSSGSVAGGYWARPELSATTFHARLPDDTRHWLKTGDLGTLEAGQLVVTGRLKDLVIIAGRNIYPQDIELAASRAHPSVRASGVAAFSTIQQGVEQLIVVAEVIRQHRPELNGAVCHAIRSAVAGATGVGADRVILVRANTLPRTSSGKLRRQACRAACSDDVLDIVHDWRRPNADAAPPAESLMAFVIDWVTQELTLKPDAVLPHMSLRQLGLDSLGVTHLSLALEERLERRVTTAELWDHRDIAAMVHALVGEERASPWHSDGHVDPQTADVDTWPEVAAAERRRAALLDVAGPDTFFQVHEGISGRMTTVGGRTLLNFASYDYLGLAGHVEVIRGAQEAIERWGTTVSASRLVAGERPVHHALEAELAALTGVDDALTFVGGHATNVTTISHLMGRDDLICVDALVHNSAMQGATFSGARVVSFPHNDWEALDHQLHRMRFRYRRALVVIEGVYSADGDIPDLERFLQLCERHHALLMVDEAHATGVLGATGRGLAEHAGVDPRRVDIWMGTLSKALCSTGGYIAGRHGLVNYLKTTAPGFVFSVGLSPAAAGAALAALRLLHAEPDRVRQLQANVRTLVAHCTALGLDTGRAGAAGVVPIIVGDTETAVRASAAVRALGVNVPPMIPPAVAEGAARLRLFVSASHTADDLRRAGDVVAQAMASVAAAREPLSITTS